MKAALFTDLRTMVPAEIPDPAPPGPGEVLLRIEEVGICGSDLHYYRTGRIGSQVMSFPTTLGHECAATVEAVGEGVARLRPGDRVAVDPAISCGTCDQCRCGRLHTCRHVKFMAVAGQLPGCLCEFAVMPEACCFLISDTWTWGQGVMMEPFAICLYAAKLAGDLTGQAVGILGAGPIGLCLLTALNARGPSHVVVTEPLTWRRRHAQNLGAEWTGDPRDPEWEAEVAEQHPEGLDVVFECAGEPSAYDDALRLLRPGGRLFVLGIPEHDRMSFDADLLRRKELSIHMVRRQNDCTHEALELAEARGIDFEPMITHRFPLDQAQKAFDTVADYRDGVVKALITIGR